MEITTKIEIEFIETFAYSKRSEKFEAFCPKCRSLTDMATPQTARVLSGFTEREIYRLVESGTVHFAETDRLVICLNSLSDCQKMKEVLYKVKKCIWHQH